MCRLQTWLGKQVVHPSRWLVILILEAWSCHLKNGLIFALASACVWSSQIVWGWVCLCWAPGASTVRRHQRGARESNSSVPEVVLYYDDIWCMQLQCPGRTHGEDRPGSPEGQQGPQVCNICSWQRRTLTPFPPENRGLWPWSPGLHVNNEQGYHWPLASFRTEWDKSEKDKLEKYEGTTYRSVQGRIIHQLNFAFSRNTVQCSHVSIPEVGKKKILGWWLSSNEKLIISFSGGRLMHRLQLLTVEWFATLPGTKLSPQDDLTPLGAPWEGRWRCVTRQSWPFSLSLVTSSSLGPAEPEGSWFAFSNTWRTESPLWALYFPF